MPPDGPPAKEASERRVDPRYTLVRELGRGGMGAVDLVFDAVRGEAVARKRVLRASPSSLLRLKREFRTIEPLRHPNVVALYELDEDEAGLFFTMEVVEGVGLLEHCGPRDLARLTRTIPQVIDALAFLHAHGIVHRDIKPGNVMVRSDGVVKLLDFGILAEAGGRQIALDAGVVLGTPGFMAPEQIRGQAPTPASDVYALGAMLFLLVTGRRLFEGSTQSLLLMHLATPPEHIASYVPDVPPELDRVCFAMLAKSPDLRPSLDEIARVLAPRGEARPRVSTRGTFARAPGRLVGRDALCHALAARLTEARSEGFAAFVLDGGTGAGKTAIAEELGSRARAAGALVLAGRARHNEAVPFNAVDGAIDTLSLALKTLPLDDAGVALRTSASRAFPVLVTARESMAPQAERAPQRGKVFAGVVGLLRVAAEASGGLVLFLDDLHWADTDSIALLDALASEAPPRVALLATIRNDVGPSAASAWLDSLAGVVRVHVPPLDDAASREVVRRAAAQEGLTPSDDEIERAARASGGRPFVAEVLGRALHAGKDQQQAPDSALARVLANVGALQREALLVLAADDSWMPIAELATIARVAPGVAEDAVEELERRGLARRRRSDGSEREAEAALYHDAVGAAVRALAEATELTGAHARIALHLEGSPEPSPHRLVRHMIAAGTPARALPHAREAARRAIEQRAYGLAADMLGIVLDHGATRDPELLAARGDALQRSGRYTEAASCWRELALATSGDRQLEARLLEAQAQLSAGNVAEGRACLDSALRDAGEPSTVLGGFARLTTLLRFAAGPPRVVVARSAPVATPARGIDRAELDVKLANVVGYYEPIAGMRMQAHLRDLCDRTGQLEYAAWCDFTFAYFAHFTQPKRGRSKLAERYRAAAERRLAVQPARHPAVRVFSPFLDAVAAQRDGRWDDGIDAADRAITLMEDLGLAGTLEHLFVLVHRSQMDFYGQRAPELAASLGRLRQASRDRGDSALRCHLHFAECTYGAMIGDHAASAHAAARAHEQLPKDAWTFQRTLMTLAMTIADVHTTDCREARRRVHEALREGRAVRPLATMYAGHLSGIAALVEACALRNGDPEARVSVIRGHARRCRVAPPLAHTVGARALAYAEDEQGNPEEAVRLLADAEADALGLGQRVDAAIARFQRGLRLGGDGGKTLCAEARALVAQAGAREIVLAEDPKRR